MELETSVLIVGGGLNGLTATLLLAHQGVRCMVVERHPGTSVQYKFAGLSPRSMEIFRAAGIEGEIRSHRTGDQQAGGVARCKTLSDPDVNWMMESAWPDVAGLSATSAATCDQHVLEPILRNEAEHRGADVRFNTEFVSFLQKDDGVDAIIRERASGAQQSVHASYMIGADGANGTLRERLGVDRAGPGVLQHWMNIIFETDLEPLLQGKRFTSCFVTSLNATLTPRDNGRWLLAVQYDPTRESPESFDAQRCAELVRAAAGRPHVKADLVDARAWEVAGSVARRFTQGRIFLVGDAAHVMPPTGAFGGNTGIHDAHNLAWKLAFVLNGGADEDLLSSYDRERRPIAVHSLEQALARLQAWFKDTEGRLPKPVEIVDGYDVVFGQYYRDGAIAPEADEQSARPFEPARELSARPGTRAPHLMLERAGQPLPVHDLFGRSLVLLSGASCERWHAAGEHVVRSVSFPMKCYRIGVGGDLVDPDGDWPDRYGASSVGAVLVRPDGFVAWRARELPSNPQGALRDAIGRIGLRFAC